MKKINVRKSKPRRLKIKTINRMIKGLGILGLSILFFIPGFSFANLSFNFIKAGIDQILNPQAANSVIQGGEMHNDGTSYDNANSISELYSGKGPVDFTFSDDSNDTNIHLNSSTLYPLADDGVTGEIEDNKNIEIHSEWKFEKKWINSEWQRAEREVATLTITYKNKTSNLGLLSSPLFDFTQNGKDDNTYFLSQHYPFYSSVDSNLNFTALASLRPNDSNQVALYYQYLAAGSSSEAMTIAKNAIFPWEARILFPGQQGNEHVFSGDVVKNWLQLPPTSGEDVARYEMSFELNDETSVESIQSFKIPVTFQSVALNASQSQSWSGEATDAKEHLYSKYTVASKIFDKNKSYEMFAVRPGATYEEAEAYLMSNLGWATGFPTLKKGSMFGDNHQLKGIEIKPFARLSVGSDTEGEIITNPEDYGDFPVKWSAFIESGSNLVEADNPDDPDHYYVAIDGKKITAKKPGNVIIRAEVTQNNQTFTAQESLEIYDPSIPTGLLMDELREIEVDEETHASVTKVPPTADGTITWESATPGVAAVNASTGMVKGISPGTSVIKATLTYAKNGQTITIPAEKTITVVPKRTRVESVAIEPLEDFELVLPDDATSKARYRNLKAVVLPENASNKKVSWTSSNPAVATVNDQGLVQSSSPGVAVITATSEDDFTKTSSVTVTVQELSVIPVESIIVEGNETNAVEEPAYLQRMFKRQKHKIKYTLYPSYATQKEVVFSIDSESEPGVIDLSNTGEMTAKKPGTAIVRVTSAVSENVFGRLAVVVEENPNEEVKDDATYLTDPSNVSSRYNVSSRLLANVGGEEFFPIVDRQKGSTVRANSLSLDMSLNKNIRVTTASRKDATKNSAGAWDKYVGINERFTGDFPKIDDPQNTEAKKAERASGMYAETLTSGTAKKLKDIQGTPLENYQNLVDRSTTSDHNRAMYADSYDGGSTYSDGNTNDAQTGPVIYYTQNFAPNGHLGDEGIYDSLARGDNPIGNAKSGDYGGLKWGQGQYAVNFRQAVYMKYEDYAEDRYSSSASVVFPPMTTSAIANNNHQTLKYGNGETESITVEYEEVGMFEDLDGNHRPMSAVMTISDVVYGTGASWVGASGEYRPSISFSNNLYSGFFYQNIKSFTVDLKFYAADTPDSETYGDFGKSIDFLKKLTSADFEPNGILSQTLPDNVVFGGLITFGSLNRSDSNGKNTQTEFAGAIATAEDLMETDKLITENRIEMNTYNGVQIPLMKIGIMSQLTSIGLDGNAQGHENDADSSSFKEEARGTYYAGGYTDGNSSNEFYFYDRLGMDTYPRGGVSFPIWGSEHKFFIGGSKAHTYNSISSRSLRAANQGLPNKTVSTRKHLLHAPQGFYSGAEDSFDMRYDNDLDRLWQLEVPSSIFANQYINGDDPLNCDYYRYYSDLSSEEKNAWFLNLIDPNYVGAVHSSSIFGEALNEATIPYLTGFNSLTRHLPLLKYWQTHGKTGQAVVGNDGLPLLPVKNQRFVGLSGVVNTNGSDGEGNAFNYYINQPMVDFFNDTAISPSTIVLNDVLPEGVEMTGGIEVYDNFGDLITTFSQNDVLVSSDSSNPNRQKIRAILQETPLQTLVAKFISQTKTYGDILSKGISNEFTYKIPVQVKSQYRGTYRDYANAAMVTFTYEGVGEHPRSHVTNAVQVVTRGKAVFSFNKEALVNDGSGSGPVITEGVEFKLYDEGVRAQFPNPANLTNEYRTAGNEHPIYSSSGYFEVVLRVQDLVDEGATTMNRVHWMVLNEEKTNAAYDSSKLRRFDFGVYVDQVNHQFVFLNKKKEEIMRVSTLGS